MRFPTDVSTILRHNHPSHLHPVPCFVGNHSMTFIIAEIGINHNGNLNTAKKLIDAAQWAGADAVKFQKRTVEIVYKDMLDTPRESPWGKTLGAQKFGLEFDRGQYDLIDDYCKDIGIPWFASAWDVESLDFLDYFDLPYMKVASAMATNHDFLVAVEKRGKPTYLSTAMCKLTDISHALDILTNQKSCPVTLMHCVGTYPADEKDLNLRMIETLAEIYKLPVGYSGHEASLSPSVMAVVLGAVAIERHITLDRSSYGSDQAASLEPEAFRNMVNQIRKIPTVLGDGIKIITEGEMKVADKLRWWL